ncbi:MAG: hypothetical protein ABI182_05855 [Candidatus Baltobacteraceae bacterium]
MPFLNLVHLRELHCAVCKAELAVPGSRSFVVDENGDPVLFKEDQEPAEMIVEIVCPNGHTTEAAVPNELAAEPSLQTPDDAPIALDARFIPSS